MSKFENYISKEEYVRRLSNVKDSLILGTVSDLLKSGFTVFKENIFWKDVYDDTKGRYEIVQALLSEGNTRIVSFVTFVELDKPIAEIEQKTLDSIMDVLIESCKDVFGFDNISDRAFIAFKAPMKNPKSDKLSDWWTLNDFISSNAVYAVCGMSAENEMLQIHIEHFVDGDENVLCLKITKCEGKEK